MPNTRQPVKVRKAVFPVAGLGTRFLPATKASPKEMLPVVDKPLIQYAVEEAIAAGVEVLIFVNGRNKYTIPNHFDKAYELEQELEARGKEKLLKLVRGIIPDGVTCVYIRQAEALGLGHAVLCARPVVGDEPFAVLLADDLIYSDHEPGISQMINIYNKHQASVLAVEEVPGDDIQSYGVVDTQGRQGDLVEIAGIVEKPKPENAPSHWGVVGRYVLQPRIFSLLQETPRGSGGEIQLTDAIQRLLQEEKVLAYRFQGKRYDCGSKIGYLKANVEYGLCHSELGEEFKQYLRELAGSNILD
jgi:UTP--glucose-1-phosphate uridylyltransferase